MRFGHAVKVVGVGLLLTLLGAPFLDRAAADSESITGTATTTGGSTSSYDFSYSSPGVLGSGTMHIDLSVPTGSLTRSDGATLTGKTSMPGDIIHPPVPLVIGLLVTSGTGELAGATGEIVLTGTSTGLGVAGDVFDMTGLVLTPPPVTADAESITGTATTTGGSTSSNEFTYSSPGVLGSGTIHTDFTITFIPSGLTTVGTFVLTRSDRATLTGTETSTGDISQAPIPLVIHLLVTSGTGELAGATGEIVLTGAAQGPGVPGDVFDMTGSLTTAPPASTETSAATEGTTTLPRTGASPTTIYLGCAMVITGGCLVILSRRQLSTDP